MSFKLSFPDLMIFYFFALRKRLSLKLNFSIKIKDNFDIVFLKADRISFVSITLNLSLNAY